MFRVLLRVDLILSVFTKIKKKKATFVFKGTLEGNSIKCPCSLLRSLEIGNVQTLG